MTVGAGGHGFDSLASHIRQCRQRLATAVMFLWSGAAQALSYGDEPCDS